MGANVAPGLNDTELQKKVTLMQRSALSFGAFHRKKGHKETQSQTVPPVCIVTVIMYVHVVVVVVVVKSPRALTAQVPVSVPTSFLSTDHLPTTYRPPTDHLPTTFLRCSLFTITVVLSFLLLLMCVFQYYGQYYGQEKCKIICT